MKDQTIVRELRRTVDVPFSMENQDTSDKMSRNVRREHVDGEYLGCDGDKPALLVEILPERERGSR